MLFYGREGEETGKWRPSSSSSLLEVVGVAGVARVPETHLRLRRKCPHRGLPWSIQVLSSASPLLCIPASGSFFRSENYCLDASAGPVPIEVFGMVRGLLGKIASRSLSLAGKWQQQQLRRLNIHEYQVPVCSL